MTVFEIQADTEHVLFGREGELYLLRISVEPRLLEDLLETLAALDFPVNPELLHQPNEVTVEFPAYARRIDEVRAALDRNGFDASGLKRFRILGRTGGG